MGAVCWGEGSLFISACNALTAFNTLILLPWATSSGDGSDLRGGLEGGATVVTADFWGGGLAEAANIA